MQPMKRTFRSAIWPLLGLLTVACAAPDGRNLPAAEDFESLSAQFAAPSKEYGSAPLFVWNKVVTPERIDEAPTSKTRASAASSYTPVRAW